MIHYVCKYTPTELFQGFGEKCAVWKKCRKILKVGSDCPCKSVRLRKIRDSGGAGRKGRGTGACQLL